MPIRPLLRALPLFAASVAMPALAAPMTATVKVVTLRPLSIVKLRDLDFGNAIAGPVAGTITIDPYTDGRTVSGGVTTAGGTAQAAQFYTYGGPLQYVLVTRGALPTLSNGTATMSMTQLTLNGPVLRYLDAAGLLDLRVGGTLNVATNQAPGTYSGTFDITVTYF